ncbi:DUF1876 domain-containing protein [Nocardioides insulae]|uniref:DUF1876 domain-containing protein n=1 Tax=Nocardioides insulae TaxID=394734 RepID=UPI00042236A2|nr:DUF1876 domain-containing protein [Nocardioides insulae]
MTTKTWTIEVRIEEEGDVTLADAVWSMENKAELRGHGTSRRNPHDHSVPRIGDELAVARALSDLAYQLLGAAADDIESYTHRKARSLAL